MPRNLIVSLSLFIAFGSVPYTALTQTAGPAPSHVKPHSPSGLNKLISDIAKADDLADPIQAGLDGNSNALRRLPDVSLDAANHTRRETAAFLTRHKNLQTSNLSAEERLNYELIGFVLAQRHLIAPYDTDRIPFTNDSGFYGSLTSIARQSKLITHEDYEAYIERLSFVPAFFEQHIENMRRGISTGYTAPKGILTGVIAGIENLSAIASEDHPLAAPLNRINPQIDEPARKALRERGLTVIHNQVMPAYRQLLGFMETEYLPSGRAEIGLSTTPNGKAHYEALVKYYTTLDVSPDEVHAIGLSEVARIRAEMDEVITSSGFEGTFKAFLEFLRTDPQFYASSREDLLKEAAWIAKRVDGKMPEFFGTLPRLPYGVIAVPKELEQNYTTGRYFSGNARQGKAGNYVVNTYDLPQRPLYNLPALTLHEGVPGHHHQISLAAEQNDVPKFRQSLYPHAFGEGWALYVEKLGVEMGIYRTPYEHFGRLTYEMWRACRLVMDTGIHYKGWSRAQAQACLIENSALSSHNIETETDRYIAWPGQALAYKMGELKIWELRAKAEAQLGSQFSLAQFHDAVLLNGALPLSILEVQIDKWLLASKQP